MVCHPSSDCVTKNTVIGKMFNNIKQSKLPRWSLYLMLMHTFFLAFWHLMFHVVDLRKGSFLVELSRLMVKETNVANKNQITTKSQLSKAYFYHYSRPSFEAFEAFLRWSSISPSANAFIFLTYLDRVPIRTATTIFDYFSPSVSIKH